MLEKNQSPGAESLVPLKDMLTYRLARLNAKLSAQASRILKDSAEISLGQWRILVFLDVYDTCKMTDFVRFSGFDKGQVSRNVSELIKLGLVAAERSETDQRTQNLSMTPLGRQTFERARPAMRRRQAALLETLSEDERVMFYFIIEKLEDVAGAAPEIFVAEDAGSGSTE